MAELDLRLDSKSESEDEEVIDDLTVALYLDAIHYDAKSKQYEIELSDVQLLQLDTKRELTTIRLKIPSHRLQRIKTPIFNAESFENHTKRKKVRKKVRKIIHETKSDISDVDEITGIIVTNVERTDSDDEKKSYEFRVTPKQPAMHAIAKNHNIDIKPLQKDLVQREWNDIIKKYKLSDDADDELTMTKDGCFKRIIFVLKHYTRWILYKAKHFQAQETPSQHEDFCSISSLFHILEGYDKIKLLNDYYYLLKNALLTSDNNNNNDLEELILNNDNILHCEYCLNRLNRRNAELYKTDKLSATERRTLYFIHDSNHEIEEGSVEERVEIGIQQYLDILYCSLFYPSNFNSDTNKYLDDLHNDEDNDISDGEYFTYWKQDAAQFCRAKYSDLKTELLSNTIYAIEQRDFFYLYNRAKDFLLSIMGKSHTAKRIKAATKIKIDQRLTINHVMSLLLYCNYYDDFIGSTFIKRGCMQLNHDESFGDIRLRNNEIANWCRLLNEAIFCWGNMLIGDERLYYCINRKISFKYMSVEYNIPISTTSKYTVMQYDKGITLRLGKYEASKEYNYAFNMAFLSNYPLECEHLIFGGKFEINDIIYDTKTHYSDIQVMKLYLQIMKGRWFSHNKLLFKKQYEKKLITFILNYISENNDNDNDDNDDYMQLLFNNIVHSNGTTKKNKTIYINKETDKLLPQLKKLLTQKFVPYLIQKVPCFKKGYNTILIMKTNFNTINNSNFNKSLYSSEYKYQLLYCHNNRPQEIIFHFRCYKKYDETQKQSFFKGCFEIKQLPKCVSKIKIIGGLLLPQIQFEKWDFITLSPQKLYSGSSLFDIQKIKNFDSVILKICFQVKEVIDTDGYQIPTLMD